MTDDERNDLLELKAFLEKAIPQVEMQLINYPPDGLRKDYQFLIDKAVMYRDVLRQTIKRLENREAE
jgi:hypothetical protein